MAIKARRAGLNDFERYKERVFYLDFILFQFRILIKKHWKQLMRLKQQKARIVNAELGKLKSKK